jgi:hypothetical protein
MGGFGMPAMRRMFDPGSPIIAGSSSGFIAPAVDVIHTRLPPNFLVPPKRISKSTSWAIH